MCCWLISWAEEGKALLETVTIAERDPRKDPRPGDIIKDGQDVKRVDAVSPRKQGGFVVSYSGSFSGNGCVCGLSSWRRYYRNADVLHVA